MAAELFPLILEESPADIWGGVTFGFLAAFFFLNGFEHLIEATSEIRKGIDFNNALNSLGSVSYLLNLIKGTHKKCKGDCGCKDCGGHAQGGEAVNPMFNGQNVDGTPKKGCGPGCACHDCSGTHSHGGHNHEHDHMHKSEHGLYGVLEAAPEDDSIELGGAVFSPMGREKRSNSGQPPQGSPDESPKIYERKSKVVCDDCTNIVEASSHGSDMAVLEDDALELALHAIADPDHKDHLQGHLLEMTQVIGDMETKSRRFIEDTMTTSETEMLAEEVDQSIHQLQYQLDHCRRLLQGSEANMKNGMGSSALATWMTEEKKVAMHDRLKLLRLTAVHLVEHIKEDNIDEELIHEMHQHMKEMDRHINHFHDIMDTYTSKWRSIPMPNIEYGATLPMSLVIPVTLDCFVDGFLIGVSVALSPKAGYVLSAANCLEMGSLGMAYSARIAKCTGSSFLNRQLAIYLPPILMLLSAGFGALLAGSAHSVPSVFVAFVAFGIYALIALVCGELIIEAKEAHADDEKWWITACLFFGMYLVLMLHPVL